MSSESDYDWEDDSVEVSEEPEEEEEVETQQNWSSDEEDESEEKVKPTATVQEPSDDEILPPTELNIWQKPNLEDYEEEETPNYAEYHYQAPGVLQGDWKDLKRQLEDFQTNRPEEEYHRTVMSSIYSFAKPVWEAIGEDRHVSFVVDLDSLLCDIVESERIDFSHGLQVLPCIHVLEKRLKQLRAGGRNPMIIVFDCLQSIWPEDRDDVQLLRQICILHLSSLKEINVFRFPNFWEEEWLQFVREYLPAFTVISSPGCESIRPECHGVFEAMLCYIQFCQDVPCVLSSTLRIKSNALYGHKFYARPARRYCRTLFGSFEGMMPLNLRSFAPKMDLDLELWENVVTTINTDKEFQVICYACASYLKRKGDKGYTALLILAFELQKILSLDQRRFILNDDTSRRHLPIFLNDIYQSVFSVLSTYDEHASQINSQYAANISTNDEEILDPLLMFVDLIDGRLLYKLAESKALVQDEVRLGVNEEMLSDLNAKWSIICELSGLESCPPFFPILERDELRTFAVPVNDEKKVLLDPVDKAKFVQVQSGLVSSLFEQMDQDMSAKDALSQEVPQERSYFWERIEENNWQYGQKVNDAIAKHPPATTPQEKRSAQKYLTFIEKYSKSLQPGKIVLRDVIVARAPKEEAEEVDNNKKGKKGKNKKNNKQNKNKKGGKGRKGKGKGKKIDVRKLAQEEIERKKREEKIKKTTNLINYLKQVHPNTPEGLEQRIKTIDEKFEAEGDPQSALPGLMQLREWCEEAAIQSKTKSGIDKIVRLWQVTHDILRRFCTSLDTQQMKLLQRSMLVMGYDAAAASMVQYYCEALAKEGKPVSDHIVMVDPDSVESQIPAPPSYQRFQLEYGGSLMVRSVDSAYDPRVDGFYPDKWQRDLLDVVDSKGSALVVAPTSSGKTFVSWYAMKETLISNKKKGAKDKRRVVYVCPTKALSQQAAAEIYAKYGDVFGIFTSDYDHKILESEVTVVLPETFEIILTSSEREDYVNSIDYVIFDEVHCLDQGDGGEVWERLFMLVRCPFIALSATVGEPHIFQKWLTRIGKPFALSKAKKNTKYADEIQLISHNLRWSDLQKYIYLPHEYCEPGLYESGDLHIKCFSGRHEWKSNCIDIHPAAAVFMGNGLNHFTNGFPPNLSFSPKDSLAFYDSMRKEAEMIHKNEGDSTLMQSLNVVTPDNYFDPLVIKKASARDWEYHLKGILWEWCKMGYREQANRVLEELAHVPQGRIQRLENACNTSEDEDRDCYSYDYVADHITSLLIDLEQTDRLPALIFCLDRRECELLLRRIVNDLEQAEEAEKKKSSLQSNEERRLDKKVQKDIKKIQKQISALEKTSGRSKDDDGSGGSNKSNSKEQIEALEEQLASLMGSQNKDANSIDERFTFVKNGERLDEDELEYWRRRSNKRNMAAQGGTHINMRCLDRGIGLHHEGLGRTYKQLVETLFRAKQLKIVIATKTLAMGVNMPARTVIFAGDHPDLNPLAYRQMMGRAGRRGYDNIGHVVFLGIRPRKVAYLMTSELLSLTGHYPVKPTMCLKLAQQYEAYEHRDECVIAMKNLYTPPFDRRTEHDVDATAQYKRNTRFLNEILFHWGLMDQEGRCKSFGGVAAHLVAYEPANLIFTRLLETGIFHVLTHDYDKNKIKQVEVAQRLMLVLCHIFHSSICLPPERSGNVLPPLSSLERLLKTQKNVPLRENKTLDEFLRQFDIEIYSLYEHFTNTLDDVSECEQFTPLLTKLPLSKLDFAKQAIEVPDNEEHLTLFKMICEDKPPVSRISKFIAISNPDDSFNNQQDIILHGRDDFIFDSSAIPVSQIQDARGRKLQKNAFAYNFFCHGDYSQILKQNQLRDGLAWNYLKKWQLLLKDIRHALRSISGLAHKLKEKEIENRRIANQQEKDTYTQWSDRRSVYKGALLLKDYDGKVIKVLGRRGKIRQYEEVKETEDMIDQLVQAFSFLSKEFSEQFRNITLSGEDAAQE